MKIRIIYTSGGIMRTKISAIFIFLILSLIFTGFIMGNKKESKETGKSKPCIKKGKFDEFTINEFQEEMKNGNLTSVELTKYYLERINAIDKNGPNLNSVIEINPDAIKIAEKLDIERKQKGPRSKLHGIPIMIKANIDTKDSMETTAGSMALKGNIASKDAFIVKKLRKAGAVILGKTNLSEWANFRSTRSSSGWCSIGGLTKNPYALDRNTSGSSSGSAAAVSGNLCAVAIGTETDGSVVSPSSTTGIVGIKPSLGLASRTGIIPIAHSQDTAGSMARTVEDAAILLDLISGYDSADPITKTFKTNNKGYQKFLDKNGLKGARIGVARNYFGFHEKVDQLMEESIKIMKSQGALIIEATNIKTPKNFGDLEFEVLLYEFKSDLNKYLKNIDPKIKICSLKDIIEFNKKNMNKVMPYFRQELLIMAQEKGTLLDEKYIKALKESKEMAGKSGIDATMDKYNLDAIIAPTNGPAWKTDLINGDHYSGGCSSEVAVAGYPHITVPAGYVHGLPIGISFIGRNFSEGILIKIAYAYEKATQFRKPPKFKEKIEK